jgi:hypothetical protein
MISMPTANKTGDFAVEWWPIGRPKPYPKNARKWTAKAVEKVAASIREFGWRQPLVCDVEDVIVIGHLRLAAAQSLGLDQVPVHVARDLSPAKIRALRLADNRLHEESLWDYDLLKEDMLDLSGLDLDLSMTGFEQMEIDGRMFGVSPEWDGMPEFEQQDLQSYKPIKVHFRDATDREAFAKTIGQDVADETRYVWFPKLQRAKYEDKRYVVHEVKNPSYPVYIISKGRWDTPLTVRALEAMDVPYMLVVEPQEVESYAPSVVKGTLKVLPFSDLGQGSIPARNWVWDDAVSQGADRHWIIDDNIYHFYRLNNNTKIKVESGVCFKIVEDYSDRFTNVALAGFNYEMFAPRKAMHNPLVFNTRIYSCILVKNDLPYRWRGLYNEDTDLSLRALKDGWCTVQFNALLADKVRTMLMKGGNTDELYQGDGRLRMAESLRDQHPDCVTITRKWNRWQHQVDYSKFKNNKFIPKPGFVAPTETDNYGMELVQVG